QILQRTGILAVDDDVVVEGRYSVVVDGGKLRSRLVFRNEIAAVEMFEVTVSFKKSACSDAPDDKDYTTVRFEVVEEGGKP
ncbi:hypothetical protein AB9E13_35120, partial [Rhizobium leguminosarum]